MMPSLKRLTNGAGEHPARPVRRATDLFEIMDMPPETDAGRRDIARTRGDIRFEMVRMAYPRGEFEALRGDDLHCAPGRVTALVGRSGSGKSSLVSLLPRFYDAQRRTHRARRRGLRRVHAGLAAPADRLGRPKRGAVRRHRGQQHRLRRAGRRQRGGHRRRRRGGECDGVHRAHAAGHRTRRSGRAATRFPAASASASRSPARSSRTRRS